MGWRVLLLSVAVAASGCSPPGHVDYAGGQCVIDGRPATLPQVEVHQALVQARIEARQPWLTLVTVLVLVLAGMSQLERLVALFRTRKSGAHGLADRLRLVFERQRQHPVRWFTLVAGTFGLLVCAGATYVWLDVDKRASERAQNMLNFCHLALRSADEQTVLDQQKSNLLAIQATAGDIRQLVDKLPPEEQRKAQQIVEQMNSALGKQNRLVGEYLQRSQEVVKLHTQAVERGLSSVEAGVLGLKTLPQGMHDVAEQVHKVEGRLAAIDGKLAADGVKLQAEAAKLLALENDLKALLARPSPTCAPCVGDGTARPDAGTRLSAAPQQR